jgi:hypothetical protein
MEDVRVVRVSQKKQMKERQELGSGTALEESVKVWILGWDLC